MENLICPACQIPLTRITTERGIIWHCEKCDGRAVGVSLLRGTFTAECINPIWLHAIHHEGRAGRACPACLRAMIDVPLATGAPVNVEVCQLCQMIWFDAGEIQSLTQKPPPPEKSPPLPQKAREAFAIAKVESLAESARELDSAHGSARIWGLIADALFYLVLR